MSKKPVVANGHDLKEALGNSDLAILFLYNGDNKRDKPLHDAVRKAAKKHGDETRIVKVDVAENPGIHAKYDHLATPALVTLTKKWFWYRVKSQAGDIRPADFRTHLDHLLNDAPLPEEEEEEEAAEEDEYNPFVENDAAHVDDKSFRKEVLKSKHPVLVDFWAPWCQPCLAVAPFIDKMAKEYRGRVKVVKLNVDQNPVIARRFQIQSIPTLMMFDNGQPVERRTGGNPRVIQDMIEEALL